MNEQTNVFVSYANEDKALALRLVMALTERLPPSFALISDANFLSPGDNIFARIAEALSQADALIIIISEASSSSRWVRSEMAWALAQKEGKLPIFPVLFGTPNEVPYLLRSRLYIDFSDERRFSENIDLLASAILRKFQNTSLTKKNDTDIANELDFVEVQRTILESEQEQELRRKLLQNKKLLAALTLIIIIGTSFTALVFLAGYFSGYMESISTLASIALSPLLGMFGSALGYYFGRHSNEDAGIRNRDVLKRKFEASQ